MSKNKRNILIGFVGGFGTLLLLIILIAVLAEVPEETTDETPQRVEATAGPAIATRAVTRPTATPTPMCPTPAEAAYIDDLLPILPLISGALFEFSGLSTEASIDLSVLFDEGWKIEIGTQMVLITLYSQDILDLDPPSSFRAVTIPLEEAAQGYIASMEAIANGIDNFDESALLEGVRLLEEANAGLEQSNQAMENHC